MCQLHVGSFARSRVRSVVRAINSRVSSRPPSPLPSSPSSSSSSCLASWRREGVINNEIRAREKAHYAPRQIATASERRGFPAVSLSRETRDVNIRGAGGGGQGDREVGSWGGRGSGGRGGAVGMEGSISARRTRNMYRIKKN